MRRRDVLVAAVAAGAAGLVTTARASQRIKCVIVGDSRVGKTWALTSYTTGNLPAGYSATSNDAFSAGPVHRGASLEVTFWDTSGSEDYDRLRPLAYPQTDVFIVAFAINSRASFDNILSKWVPEVLHHTPNARMVLAGLKSDLRQAAASELVATRAGEDVAASLHIPAYRECSAITQQGLGELMSAAFDVATGSAPTPPRRLQRVPIGRPLRPLGN